MEQQLEGVKIFIKKNPSSQFAKERYNLAKAFLESVELYCQKHDFRGKDGVEILKIFCKHLLFYYIVRKLIL